MARGLVLHAGRERFGIGSLLWLVVFAALAVAIELLGGSHWLLAVG